MHDSNSDPLTFLEMWGCKPLNFFFPTELLQKKEKKL